MGRQKQYQKSILVRVSNDEYRQLTERFEQAGVSLSRLLVDAAPTDGALTNEHREQAQVDLFVREWAVTEVSRVGYNLKECVGAKIPVTYRVTQLEAAS
jgi:hypothetical protein